MFVMMNFDESTDLEPARGAPVALCRDSSTGSRAELPFEGSGHETARITRAIDLHLRENLSEGHAMSFGDALQKASFFLVAVGGGVVAPHSHGTGCALFWGWGVQGELEWDGAEGVVIWTRNHNTGHL